MLLHRCQVVLAHKSGLPRDVVTNTFHFVEEATPAGLDQLAGAVRNFYTVDPVAAGTAKLADILGTQIADSGHQVRVYSYESTDGTRITAAEAPPDEVIGFTLGRSAVAVESHTSEVAVCLSMRNTTEVAVPAARRRGRVYIGPLERLISTDVGGDGVPRVHPSFRDALIAGGEKMMADAGALGYQLVVWSRPFEGRDVVLRPGHPNGDLPALPARQGNVYPVQQFFVDDAFDTIRRRGERPVNRTMGLIIP